MGRRLAHMVLALIACLTLACALPLPAQADEAVAAFAVDAASLALENVDGGSMTQRGPMLTYEDAATRDDGTQADVELRFLSVSLGEGGAFASAELELAVVDAPKDALVALAAKQPGEGEALLIGPASGFGLCLELQGGELLWSVDEGGSEHSQGSSVPLTEDDVREGVSWVLGKLGELGDLSAELKLSLPDIGFEGLSLPSLDFDALKLSLPKLDFDRLGQKEGESGPNDVSADLDDYVIDEYDFDGEDFNIDEWEDEPEVIYHTVTFKDPDGRILDVQEVEHGGAATAPKIPRRVDETFLYWDRDFSYVTGDLVVRAVYTGSVPATGDAAASAAAVLTLVAMGALLVWSSRKLAA